MPEGVKLSDKSETLHKHVENCMCYHSTIASGQLANAFLEGWWLVGFFFTPTQRYQMMLSGWVLETLLHTMWWPWHKEGKSVCWSSHRTGNLWMANERGMFKLLTLATGQSIWHSFLKRKIIGEEESDFLKSRIVYLLNCHQEFASLPFF